MSIIWLDDKTLCVTLPVKTVSEANSGGHWRAAYTRHQEQKFAIASALRLHRDKIVGRLPCHIHIKRYGKKLLDVHDNLPYSLKWCIDSIANELRPGLRPGRADDSAEITVSYDQEEHNKYWIYFEMRFR